VKNRLQPEILAGSVFGLGFFPFAPGTFASLVATIPAGAILWFAGREWLIMFVVLTSLLTIWAGKRYEQMYGQDPGSFVLDEWAGMGFIFMLTPLRADLHDFLILLGSGFLLFRFFDIVKPLGIRRIQRLPDGFGILFDDLLAGFYALICMYLLILYVL
jgi:phosphatidylglycerophosphatase A